MYLTEKEIMFQHEALHRTYDYIWEKRDEIRGFFGKGTKKVNIMGCGSSYMLAKSGQRMFASCENGSANAIAGGDYLTNPEYYKNMVKDSIIISLSRSGKTTEMVRAIRHMKETTECKVLSLSMIKENDLISYADMNLTMEWGYDESVCQTRTVTNLYLALAMLYAICTENDSLLASLRRAVEQNEVYKEEYRSVCKAIADKEWGDVVVLADGAVVGLAEEGALAFTEISMIPGHCFNMLDYRHGPMVLNREGTLTIMLIQPGAKELQKAMAEDVRSHNGVLVTVSDEKEGPGSPDAHVCIGDIGDYIAWGIPFINIIQMTAYEKAILKGTNPDAPTGLDAYITL